MKKLFILLIICSISFHSCSDNKQRTANTCFSTSFNFDADDFLNRDVNGNVLKIEDAGSTDKKPNIFKPEFSNLFNLVRKTKDMQGAIIVSGAPADYPDGVPDETDEKVKSTLNQFNVDLKTHITTFLEHSKKLTPTRLKGRPAGNVSFQPIASGNEKYHVYHITFASGYAEQFIGSKKKKKEHPEYEKGITIFVPIEKAGEIRISAASIRGTNISNIEAIINMSPDHTYRYNIPNGGGFKAIKINDSIYTISGNLVLFNLQNNQYDTILINPNKIEVKYSLALDMDGHIKRNIDSIKKNFIQNLTKANYIKLQIADDVDLKTKKSETKKVWTKAEIDSLDKRQREYMRDWAENGAMASVKSYIDSNHKARVFSFDAKATNFNRYEKSPCYNTLGFSPFGELIEQEKRYLKCEEIYYKKRNKNLLIFSGMFLILASIVYIGVKKRQYL